MEIDFKRLISLNLEMEGLARLLDARESAEALGLLRDKAEEYLTLLGQASCPVVPVAEELPEPEEFTESECAEEDVEAPVPEAEEKPSDDFSVSLVDEAAPSSVSVAAAPQQGGGCGSAENLAKAFTLNDKFRFRRELFGGSEKEFFALLGLVAGMNSFDEAHDYLCGDLQWDEEEESVADFLAILKDKFK